MVRTHRHITLRPGRATQSTGTHRQTRTIIITVVQLFLSYFVCWVAECVRALWCCCFFGKRSAKEWSKLRPKMLPIFFYCHPVRQESKSYFIRSVHIMNIQEYICNREWDFFHGFWYSDFITCVYIISALHTVRYRWLSCNTIPCRFYVVSFWCVLVFVLHFFSPHFVFFH